MLKSAEYRGAMRLLTILCAVAFSSACAPTVYEVSGFPHGRADSEIPENATRIAVSGQLFERLSGQELVSAITGNRMFIDSSVIFDSATSHFSGEYFSSDGLTYYWTRFRQGHGKGTYAIHQSKVCSE